MLSASNEPARRDRLDSTRVPLFGPNPQGQANFDSNGRYILMTARTGQVKFTSTNRLEGTPEENKAVVQGSIDHFGRYTVDEANKTITFQIETSTFPNWNGTEQKRLLSPIVNDELQYITPTASSGGVGTVTWRRVK